jgi:GT2 family glycosyltransferase/glycosyltransferase involved in cell wall biosynthesis
MTHNQSGLRPRPASVERERDSLLRQVLLFEALVQTRRWSVVERLFGRYAGPKAVDEIANILKRYRRSSAIAGKRFGKSTRRQGEAAWLTDLCNHLPRLIQTRRWRLGRFLFAPVRRVQGRDARARERRILRMVREGRALLDKEEMRRHRTEILLWDLSNDAEGFLRSREWRVGKTIGDVVERLFRVPSDEESEQKILATLDSYRAWMHRRPRVVFQRDRERAIERYHRYIQNVEAKLSEQAKATGSSVSVRVIVLSPDGGPLESVSSEQHLESVSAVTVLLRNGGTRKEKSESNIEELVVDDGGDIISSINTKLREWPEDYLVFLEIGDRLSPWVEEALGDFVAECIEPPLAILFDHDRIDPGGRRVDPEFTPGFSPELLIEHDYVGRAAAFHRENLIELGGFHGYSPHVIRSTLWKGFAKKKAIAKLDRVLLHTAGEQIRTDPQVDDGEFSRWALKDRGDSTRANVQEMAHGPQVRYTLPENALVSIIITFSDKVELLKDCVDSISRLTTHNEHELILVNHRSGESSTLEYLANINNNPRVTIVDFDEKFNFSRANNLGAQVARGDYLIFLNNDIKILTPDWIEQLCGYASLRDIGAVGAKLLFGDGSIQHAGVVVGMTGFANHVFAHEHEPFLPPSYMRYTRNCSAVTAACMAIERRKFLELGGFDERLTLTGNDVDLCIRLSKTGRRNVFIPTVNLFHYEKSTRSEDSVAEHNKRLSLLTYRTILRDGDPYYNSNLSLKTTRFELKTSLEETPESGGVQEAGTKPDVSSPLEASSRFIRLYDLSRQELADNRAVVEGFRRNRIVEPETITWFIPHFDHIFRGGIFTVMRIADHFSHCSGTLNRFVLHGRESGDVDGMEEQISLAFPNLLRELILLPPGNSENDLPASNIAFCTLWTSAYQLARYNRCQGKFYLVQDFEGSFSRQNSVFGLAEETYRFGFIGVANTPGVCSMYESYGNEAEYFIPAVDRTIFSPATLDLRNDSFRIVFYGRPDKPRNAFALAVESLRELKRRQGDRVEILSVGAEYDVKTYNLEGVLVNLGLLPDIQTVASVYRHSHIGLVFMLSKHPSYQPLEFMASGCAVVTNVNEANSWLLRHRENSMTVPPLKTPIVEAIEELMDDEQLRKRLLAGGLKTISQTTWERELDVVHKFVIRGERRSNAERGAQRYVSQGSDESAEGVQ